MQLIMQSRVTALDVQQVAYPVGPDADAYYIYTYFTLDLQNGQVKVEHKAAKNWYSLMRNQDLFTGTYQECFDYINNLVNPITP